MSCNAGAASPGHAVGVLCRNGRSFVAAVFAAAMVGADVVLLNTDFRAESLAAALRSHRIGLVVCDSEFASHVRDADDGVRRGRCGGCRHARRCSRPAVARAGRIVLLTSGTTGRTERCAPSAENPDGIGHRRVDPGSHGASDWITNLGACAHVSRPGLRHADPDPWAWWHCAHRSALRRRSHTGSGLGTSRRCVDCCAGHACAHPRPERRRTGAIPGAVVTSGGVERRPA